LVPPEVAENAPKDYDTELIRLIRIHGGFFEAFQTVQTELFSYLEKHARNRKLYLTGHSLGGALAVVNLLFLLLQPRRQPVHGIYTFGQPKVGNDALAQFLEQYSQCKLQRVCNNLDVVPSLPLRSPYGFKTCGRLVYVNKAGKLMYGSLHVERQASRLQRIIRVKQGISDHRTPKYVCFLFLFVYIYS
jgi:triacylglycerol lipase